MAKLKIQYQKNSIDCGPTCLKMVSSYYNKKISINSSLIQNNLTEKGISLYGLSEIAESIGFRARGVKITLDQLLETKHTPSILYWDHLHYVVFSSKSSLKKITVADPARGILTYSKEEFLEFWSVSKSSDGEKTGIALLLEPTNKFYDIEEEQGTQNTSWSRVLPYISARKAELLQVVFAIMFSSLLQLLIPFITQSVVDTGIATQNMQFVSIVLIAQSMLILSRLFVEFIRSRTLLYVSATVSLSILSDFWTKVTKLPISHFVTHTTGDTLQRLNESRKIESFLTGTLISTIFSVFNFFTFSFVLFFYNEFLFGVFAFCSIIYFLWARIFLRFRKKINYQNFDLISKENNLTLQIVQGMQELKLNNAEKAKRWEWEDMQAARFKLSFKNLKYGQIQQLGGVIINETKNIGITFLVANMVIKGELSLGTMLAIQYVLGQLSSPIEQLITFIQSHQDAKISLDRLNEIHNIEEEEPTNSSFMKCLSDKRDIVFSNVSFKYPGSSEYALKNISLTIQQGKTTAIVGLSGSGKTTLIKLVLQFYKNYLGEIKIGDMSLRHMSPSYWRKHCGVIMQEGFIFTDSVEKNIAIGENAIDFKRIILACKTANILDFVEALPGGFKTRIGSDGVGLSQGQKQRLLIARAVYKDPDFLFLDEATNALDASNERVIVDNLSSFFRNRTVVVIAHRLSTVKNADNILVIDNGSVVEEGTHEQLSMLKGKYYSLVRNQLELGK